MSYNDTNKNNTSSEEEILLGWLQTMQSGNEDDVDSYLSNVVSSEDRLLDPQKDKLKHQPIFYPGSISACLLSFSTNVLGHYELTKAVFGSNGSWSTNALTNFARASRLPDLLFFDDLKYHAQSDSDTTGLLFNPNGQADLIRFTSFLQEKLFELEQSINNKDLENIFFNIGVLFHAIQDLCCHQGMSNSEHALLNKNKQSPDKDTQRYDFALMVNNSFAESHLWEKLNKIKGNLNDVSIISWWKFLTAKQLAKLSKETIKFTHSVPQILSIANQARWFLWQCKDDDQDAFNEISLKIFSKLK